MVINMHISVLLQESIAALNLKEDGIYVDATLGYAGHSSEILKRVRRGCLFAFDQDSEAINYSKNKLSSIGNNYEIIKSNFCNLKEELKKRNVTKVDGILFDLGVSSPQLDEKERGFSYHLDARLDMRMNTEQELSAYEVVNSYDEAKLAKIFFEYGEEKYSKSIARAIVKARAEKKIETTLELVEIIKSAMPEKAKRDKHPARKVFQAIRIEVNNELEVLKQALNQALDIVDVGGRVVVITFHSLEDRAVKNAYVDAQGKCTCPKDLPYCVCGAKSEGKIINKKPIIATEEEQEENSRSKSAKLRIFEKIIK